MIGLLLCVYGALIIYLVTKPEYQRRPLPEEQVINLSFDLASRWQDQIVDLQLPMHPPKID
ncbi:hypothetical protein DERF_010184 [Dermatophagoides farinae]|uniref:Uncharacterized protein n=1 Tax=Dermatophagoides farinae TaxID=6954 RepID=A0A922HZJ9_DERFA|nr:hypothetical protein DERF_010184 [Dermatophagoides farinae]